MNVCCESVEKAVNEMSRVLDTIEGSVHKQIDTVIEQLNQTKQVIATNVLSNKEHLKQTHNTLCEQREAVNNKVAQHLASTNTRSVLLHFNSNLSDYCKPNIT